MSKKPEILSFITGLKGKYNFASTAFDFNGTDWIYQFKRTLLSIGEEPFINTDEIAMPPDPISSIVLMIALQYIAGFRDITICNELNQRTGCIDIDDFYHKLYSLGVKETPQGKKFEGYIILNGDSALTKNQVDDLRINPSCNADVIDISYCNYDANKTFEHIVERLSYGDLAGGKIIFVPSKDDVVKAILQLVVIYALTHAWPYIAVPISNNNFKIINAFYLQKTVQETIKIWEDEKKEKILRDLADSLKSKGIEVLTSGPTVDLTVDGKTITLNVNTATMFKNLES